MIPQRFLFHRLQIIAAFQQGGYFMTPKQKYYKVAAETILKNIERRGYEGCYCKTSEEAVKKALSYVTPGSSVSFGGSMTMNECGLMDALQKRDDITLLDRSKACSPEEVKEIYHKALSCDYYFMSTNAITLDGQYRRHRKPCRCFDLRAGKCHYHRRHE